MFKLHHSDNSVVTPTEANRGTFSFFTWNCEGFQRNAVALRHYADLLNPDFILLSEPNMYQCDISLALQFLQGDYCASLNSQDLYDPTLPLTHSSAHGGTMILWRAEHDPFVSIIPVECPAFLPITFLPPGRIPSIHIAVYLPTQGKESQFVDCIAKLSLCIHQLVEKHPGAAVYLRGDFNVNSNNKPRNILLEYFCRNHNLKAVEVSHPTYHHFLGNGKSDSNLDKILFSDTEPHAPETLTKVVCNKTNPILNSHHDLIISSCTLSPAPLETPSDENVRAPRVPNTRIKVVWSDPGIEKYRDLISPSLKRLHDFWLGESPSRSCVSVLIKCTNDIIVDAVAKTNRTIKLSDSHTQRSVSVPPLVRKSQKFLQRLGKALSVAISNGAPESALSYLKNRIRKHKSEHQKLLRKENATLSIARDTKLHKILSNDPSLLYKSIRENKKNKESRIQKLMVKDKLYLGEQVPDGFYDSLLQLKSVDQLSLDVSPSYLNYSEDYDHIMEICQQGEKIPQITYHKSKEILLGMKPNINDLYSITASHYIHAGEIGIQHFHLLLSSLIDDVSKVTITEINSVFAMVLFKGHGKDKNSDRSYRTISICPLIAKALDLYARELCLNKWKNDQSQVQFMGEGTSHDLAALLLTETIQASVNRDKKPVYMLFLDARSAFDSVLRKILVNNLFHTGTSGQCLALINNRLQARSTYVEFDRQLMGPIEDQLGVEQGGSNSGDYYKIFGKEQLSTAQSSKLGVDLGGHVISAIGQADDIVLISNCLHSLQNLLKLSLAFCKKNHIELCIGKTKLLAIGSPSMKFSIDYYKLTSPVNINGLKIPFSTGAEHVGILRNEGGNLPHIMAGVKAHQEALNAILHTGAARAHRGNPAASLKIWKLYALPVLMKGLGSLVLLQSEITIIAQHIKETQEKLMRLYPKTPQCVVSFLAGCLPGKALVHLKMFSIFIMICLLKGSILHQYSLQVLTKSKSSDKSWFTAIRDLCLQYNLSHPVVLLQSELIKDQLKLKVKKAVINFWETKLRSEAATLPSLQYFHPRFMSLCSTHPILMLAGPSPYQSAMS